MIQPAAVEKSLIETVTISVVVPVCRGDGRLAELVASIAPFVPGASEPGGKRWSVGEVVLVHASDEPLMERMVASIASESSFVRPIWLTKRYGNNAALLAGMASTVGDWVITLDETGGFDENDVTDMMNRAMDEGNLLVYGIPLDARRVGGLSFFRDRLVLGIATIIFGRSILIQRSSCRLVRGDVARSSAAYCNGGVDLDVALRWIVSRIGRCSVGMGNRPEGLLSGFSAPSILTLDSGLMRRILWMGLSSIILGLIFSIAGLAGFFNISDNSPEFCWGIAAIALFSGLILLALGILGECLCITMSNAMGKPLYVVASKPTHSRPTP